MTNDPNAQFDKFMQMIRSQVGRNKLPGAYLYILLIFTQKQRSTNEQLNRKHCLFVFFVFTNCDYN